MSEATVKRTSGGAFDAADRYVYFLASGAPQLLELVDPPIDPRLARHTLLAVNELHSPQHVAMFEQLLDNGSKILLDSGIFNLTNQHALRNGMRMDDALALAPDEIDGFDTLWDRYCSLVDKYADRLWGVIELDQGGAPNKRVTRARLENEIPGFVPMPVYHPVNDGWDYLDELAQQYDRICVGNVVQASTPDRDRLLLTFWERVGRYPHLWIHVLGYTPTGTTASNPPQGSCDSSAWLSATRWVKGTKLRSHLHPWSQLEADDRFAYLRGSDRGGPLGYKAGYRVNAYRSRMMEEQWRAIEQERTEAGLRPDLTQYEEWWGGKK